MAQFFQPSSTIDAFFIHPVSSASFCTSAVTWQRKRYVPPKQRNKHTRCCKNPQYYHPSNYYTSLSLRWKLFQFITNPLKHACKMVAIFRWNGLVVAQAVSRGSLTLDTRVLFQGVPCGICGGQRDIVNRVYLSTSGFTCHYHSPALHAHISPTIDAVKHSNKAS